MKKLASAAADKVGAIQIFLIKDGVTSLLPECHCQSVTSSPIELEWPDKSASNLHFSHSLD